MLELAMLGMVDGNGYPYSWSAIINGRYDAKVVADYGYLGQVHWQEKCNFVKSGIFLAVMGSGSIGAIGKFRCGGL